MKRCNNALKQKRLFLQNNELTWPIIHYGIENPYKNGVNLDKNVNTLMREINAQEHEMQAIKNIFLDKWIWIDREARNCFITGVGTGRIKCAHGYNYHGQRSTKINNGLCAGKCPRCKGHEDWEHVILCAGTDNLKQEYLDELNKTIKKKRLRMKKE